MSGSKRRPDESAATPSKPPDHDERGSTSRSPSRAEVGRIDDMPGAIKRSAGAVRRAIASLLCNPDPEPRVTWCRGGAPSRLWALLELDLSAYKAQCAQTGR